MKTLQEISNGFHVAYNEQETRCNAIKAQAEKAKQAALRYQRIAAQKMGEYYKLCDKAYAEKQIYWTDGLLRPLLQEIEDRTGWRFDDKDDLHPHGLRCEVLVGVLGEGVDEYGRPNWKSYIMFTGILDRNDDDTWHWELWYDTGEKKAQLYRPDSIGALNGFDNVSAKVESVEQIIKVLQKRMEE